MYLFRLFAVYFVILFLFCNHLSAQDDKSNSVFDMLFSDEDEENQAEVTNTNNSFSSFNSKVAEPINNDIVDINGSLFSNTYNGQLLQHAKVRILDINTGKASTHSIQVNKIKDFEDFSIQVFSCWREERYKIHPENISLIAIYQLSGGINKHSTTKNAEDIMFYGWIFSNHKSLAQPRYKNYYVQLDRCE